MKKKSLTLIILILSAIFSLNLIKSDIDDFNLLKNLEIFQNILKYLRTDYVYNIDSEQLITTAINEMLKTLDPYTNYFPANKLEELRLISEARFTGIGIQVFKFQNQFYIIKVLPNSPAQKAGLMAGDKIIAVENVYIKDLTYQQVYNLIAGDPGTYVNLKIQHILSNDTISLKIQRQNIKLNPIEYATVVDSIAYIKLTQFSDNAYQNLSANLEKFKSNGLKGIVIDLRDNPGGLLNQAVNILSLFLPQNTLVVSVKGKNPIYNESYLTKLPPFSTKIPLTILVNKNSASASEIVAGALQDLDRAVIIGEQTVGKGLVQRTVDVGYNSMLKITIAQYYIPSGRCIQGINYQKHQSTKQLPDSLLKKFYTAHGRVVYEGKGIIPDIIIKSDTTSEFVKNLLDNKIFDLFAGYYIQNFDYSKITPQTPFNDFEIFYNFLTKLNYKFSPDYLKHYNEFLNSLKNPELNQKFQALKKQLSPNLYKLIQQNKSAISYFITVKIFEHLNDKKQLFDFIMDKDPSFHKAVEVINNSKNYRQILNLD